MWDQKWNVDLNSVGYVVAEVPERDRRVPILKEKEDSHANVIDHLCQSDQISGLSVTPFHPLSRRRVESVQLCIKWRKPPRASKWAILKEAQHFQSKAVVNWSKKEREARKGKGAVEVV